jgi:GNAT superfamily N-acetyltransferase
LGNVTPFPATENQGVAFSRPLPLSAEHDVTQFDCGKLPLNDWIKDRSRPSEGRSARTYVVTPKDDKTVIGYYCICAGAVTHDNAPGFARRNAPDPIPVMVMGRLAIDQKYQGQHVGSGLLKDALQRILEASQIIGAAAVVVHAIDDDAVGFYPQYKFVAFPMGTKTLFLPIKTIAAAL